MARFYQFQTAPATSAAPGGAAENAGTARDRIPRRKT